MVLLKKSIMKFKSFKFRIALTLKTGCKLVPELRNEVIAGLYSTVSGLLCTHGEMWLASANNFGRSLEPQVVAQ